ncbi:hypothetical protein [Candidatus Tisiphia endosymbiont of Hybos culiciformis]
MFQTKRCHSRVGGNLDTCFRRYDTKQDCFVVSCHSRVGGNLYPAQG